MFGGIWKWIEDNVFAAYMRGTQRFVNALSEVPVEGDAPLVTLRLTFAPETKADDAAAVEPARRKTAK